MKAAKAGGKKTMAEETVHAEFQRMCDIKQQDLAVNEKDLVVKEKVSKMSLLDSLIAKKEPLGDYEEALKKKLISDLIYN